MNKTKIVAFLAAFTMTFGAMGTTAFAEEITDETQSEIVSEAENNDFKKIVEEKGREVKQYLLDNGITEDIADEATAYYLIGYEKRALPDGTDVNPKNAKFYYQEVLDLANLKMAVATGNFEDNGIAKFFADNGVNDEDNKLLMKTIKGKISMLQSITSLADDSDKSRTIERPKKNNFLNTDITLYDMSEELEKNGIPFVLGDANADGVANGLDVEIISEAFENDKHFDLPLQADANQDGSIDHRDISAIASAALEKLEGNKAEADNNKSQATLKGDADLNGEVGISDAVIVSKHNINSTTYPLKNEIALANADMNNDDVVDGLDTSALVEYNLGKR